MRPGSGAFEGYIFILFYFPYPILRRLIYCVHVPVVRLYGFISDVRTFRRFFFFLETMQSVYDSFLKKKAFERTKDNKSKTAYLKKKNQFYCEKSVTHS